MMVFLSEVRNEAWCPLLSFTLDFECDELTSKTKQDKKIFNNWKCNFILNNMIVYN